MYTHIYVYIYTGHVFGYQRRPEPFFSTQLAYAESLGVPGPGSYT